VTRRRSLGSQLYSLARTSTNGRALTGERTECLSKRRVRREGLRRGNGAHAVDSQGVRAEQVSAMTRRSCVAVASAGARTGPRDDRTDGTSQNGAQLGHPSAARDNVVRLPLRVSEGAATSPRGGAREYGGPSPAIRTRRRWMRTLKWTRKLVAIAVSAGCGAAISKELQKPRDERTWQGSVFGLISYDLSPAALRSLPRRGPRAIIGRSRDAGRPVTASNGGTMLTPCPNCGAEFDHEAHQLPMPEPGVDETQSTASMTTARCPQCGTAVDLPPATA
jgi:endogenous inhibitor of DNA gyrase (YacG/DUF329 family)